jgi:hypothetical protein
MGRKTYEKALELVAEYPQRQKELCIQSNRFRREKRKR